MLEVDPHQHTDGHDEVQGRVVVVAEVGEPAVAGDQDVEPVLHVDVQGALERQQVHGTLPRRRRVAWYRIAHERVQPVADENEDDLLPPLRTAYGAHASRQQRKAAATGGCRVAHCTPPGPNRALDAPQSARGRRGGVLHSAAKDSGNRDIFAEEEPFMAGRRVGGAALAAGAVMLAALAARSFGSSGSPVKFGKPLYVDKQLAGGEPIVFYDARHQDYIYSAHEGTTHTLHDGLVEGAGETASFAANYRNQVNIWTSRDGRHWTPVNLAGTGFEANPAINSGFSDPDLTQDDGGRVYNTGINLVNDALFSSADGGRTWDKGTIQCHEGDRPWLAAAHKDEVFLATDPTYSAGGHSIYRSTDGGASCGSFGIGDYGTGFTGYGKLYYNRANGSLVEPVIYGSGGGANAIGISILPHSSKAFNKQKGSFHQIRISQTQGLLTHFPGIALDTEGNIYLSWTDAPSNGKNSVWFAEMSPTGKILVKPHVISHPGTTVLWPWIVAGAPGNASIVWYQYDQVVPNPDTSTVGNVSVYQATLLGLGTSHAKKYVVNASGRPVHHGGICQGGTTCVATGQDRRLGDYLTNALDARGCVMIATGDTMSPDPISGGDRAWSLPAFIMQNAGPSLTHGSCKSKVN